MRRILGKLLPALVLLLQWGSAAHPVPAQNGAQQSFASASDREAQYRRLGMTNILEVDSTLFVDLIYARPDNVFGRAVSSDSGACYLRIETARRLRTAHDELKRRAPDLRLLVYDGLRPRSVQMDMWSSVRGTKLQKYVASPRSGSMHNYGVAVDLTLCDSRGSPLDLGSQFDDLSPLSEPRQEDRLLREGKLSSEAVARRRLLRSVMRLAGFHPIGIEWWHFEDSDRRTVRRTLPIVE